MSSTGSIPTWITGRNISQVILEGDSRKNMQKVWRMAEMFLIDIAQSEVLHLQSLRNIKHVSDQGKWVDQFITGEKSQSAGTYKNHNNTFLKNLNFLKMTTTRLNGWCMMKIHLNCILHFGFHN